MPIQSVSTSSFTDCEDEKMEEKSLPPLRLKRCGPQKGRLMSQKSISRSLEVQQPVVDLEETSCNAKVNIVIDADADVRRDYRRLQIVDILTLIGIIVFVSLIIYVIDLSFY